MTHKIGALIVSLASSALSADERDILRHPLIGGVVLFARNYVSREQLTTLCRQVRAVRKTPLLIMVDQEGGRVQRFVTEFTRLPKMADLGAYYDLYPEKALALAKACGWLMAIELISNGLDMSLAPVLDLNKGVNAAINGRAFHADPASVVALSTSFMAGMREAGMAATVKHFPGHGSVMPDSHVSTPVDLRSFDVLATDDLVPFVHQIKQQVPAVMAAHVIFPAVDPARVGFSPVWLKTILRKQLGFKGVILSDDLNMEGANISSHYVDRVVAAREAGCDLALLCNNFKGVVQVLDRLPYELHLLAEDQWGALKAKGTETSPPFENMPRWHETRQRLNELSCVIS